MLTEFLTLEKLTKYFINQENIREKINMGKDIFDRGISYKKVQIDYRYL